MANGFSDALARTERLEGKGVVQEPRGQVSFEGVLQSTFDAFNQRRGAPLRDVSTINPEEKSTLIDEIFIKEPKFNQLPQPIAGLAFDFGFQSSPKRATTALQEIVGAKPDGIIGPKTLKSIGTFIEKNGMQSLANTFLDKRASFLDGLAKNNPKTFGSMKQGFKNRIDVLRREVADGIR